MKFFLKILLMLSKSKLNIILNFGKKKFKLKLFILTIFNLIFKNFLKN